jgi:hypothetical protein
MFFKETYRLVHLDHYNNIIEKFFEGDHRDFDKGTDYFHVLYPKEIEEAILNDTSDATLALSKAESDIKRLEVQKLIKNSLFKFTTDYCKLASIWIFPHINDIYSNFFQSVYNLLDIKVHIPNSIIIESRITQGRRKSISNSELLVMIREANKLLALNYEQYKPRKNSKTSSIINQELAEKFTDKDGKPLHGQKKIGDNFRERTRFHNGKFQLAITIRCKGKDSFVYS